MLANNVRLIIMKMRNTGPRTSSYPMMLISKYLNLYVYRRVNLMSTGSKMQPQIRPIVNRDKPTTKKLGDVVMQAV